MLVKAKCPNCGKELRFLFPYNVDLHANNVVVICSNCKTHIKVNFTTNQLGKLQGVWRFDERDNR